MTIPIHILSMVAIKNLNTLYISLYLGCDFGLLDQNKGAVQLNIKLSFDGNFKQRMIYMKLLSKGYTLFLIQLQLYHFRTTVGGFGIFRMVILLINLPDNMVSETAKHLCHVGLPARSLILSVH